MDITTRRLESICGQPLGFFDDAVVFEAGCGAGRFSAVAAIAGGRVIAADIAGDAVLACRENTRSLGRVLCVHAHPDRVAVQHEAVDVAMSIGVYQHTPDPRRYLRSVASTVRRGGRLVLWGYERRIKTLLHPKYALRPITRRVPPHRLLPIVETLVPPLMGVSRAVRRLPGGRVLARAVPVADVGYDLGLDSARAQEWATLDTFDWLSPRYDRPLTFAEVEEVVAAEAFEVTRTLTDSIALVATRSPAPEPNPESVPE